MRTPSLLDIATWPLLWAEASSYADVRCYGDPRNTENEPIVIKRISSARFAGDPAAAARHINESVRHFRQGLARCSVPLIEPYECTVDGEDVVHISGYGGATVRALLAGALPEARRRYLALVVDAMNGVLRQGDTPDVGIDARLSNFCHGKAGVTYVDVFPALCLFDGEYLVHWPNPTDPTIVAKERRRKFDACGIMRRLRFDVLEAGDSDEDDLHAAIVDAMDRAAADKVRTYFAQLPDRAFVEADVDGKHRIIDGLRLEDTDLAREIAIRVIPRDEQRAVRLKQLYVNTSSFAGHHGVDPSLGFLEAKEQLHSFVR